MAGLSSAQLAKIDSALKRANTRIARLEAAYGSKSATFKNQIARFEKGPLHKYVGKSKTSVNKNGEKRGGNWKLDKGKIMKDFKSGKLNIDQMNEILRNAAGVRIDPNGIVKESNWGGFQTRKQLEEQTIQAITTTDVDLSEFADEKGNININKDILKQITEKLNAISESFQTEYSDTPLTESQMKENTILSRLYSTEHGGSRNKGEKLSYGELTKIKDELARVKSDIDSSRQKGLSNHNDLANS